MIDVPPVLHRYMTGLKRHDVQRVASAVSDDLDFVSTHRTLSKPQFLAMLQALYTAFPDWRYDHDPPEVRGAQFAIKWRQHGTHTGTFRMPGLDPIEATGRTVTMPDQHFFYKIVDDRIREIRPDPVPGGAPGGILEQIGMSGTSL